MKHKRAIIIFIKNPELGKVKTRLAKDIGDEAALAIYQELLNITRQATEQVTADKLLFYSSYIDEQDDWLPTSFQKFVQHPSTNLGDKMQAAFEQAFSQGYQQVLIVGSDCPELTPALLEQAFDTLIEKDAVVGPSKDGGYYLLGTKKMIKKLFEDKEWSTNSVLNSTINDLKAQNMNYGLLPDLNDVDNYQDLQEFEYLTARL